MADREKLWKLVKEAIHSWETDVNMSDHIADHLIANGVTIQETGYWEWDTEDIYKCSHCGDKVHVKEVMGQPDWGFCPACGARMLPEPPKGE